MTVEFPDDDVTAPAPRARFRVRPALPWAVPAILAMVALFLPVSSTLVPGDVDAVGTFRAAFRVELHPFGGYAVPGVPAYTAAGGPAFGVVWLVLLVGFIAAGVWSALRPATPWPGILGAVVGAAGVGSVATVVSAIDTAAVQRATGTALGSGAWVALASAVLGLGVGMVAVRQSASANAGG